MPYLGSFLFFGYFFYFLIAIILAFFIPGFLLLRKIPFTHFQKSVLALLLGTVLWGWQGFLFGYLHLRWLSYVYLAVSFLMFVKSLHPRSLPRTFFRVDWLLAGIVGTGVFAQILGVFFMGARISRGIMLCCGYIPDNFLELSIISEITKRFPPFEPGMFGQPLQNYHYWNHLVIAELIRVFQLPLVATTYQYSTPFYSLLFGLLFIVIAQLLHTKAAFTRWLVFFAYFGGDAPYVISFFQGRGFHLPVGSMEHGAQLFYNYPRALSVIVLLGGFSLFLQWVKDKKLFTGLLMAMVLASTIGFKVYTGVFVIAGFLAYGLFLLLRKQFHLLIPLIVTSVLMVLIYVPVNAHAGGLFYTGFWRVNDFIVLPNLYLSHMELAREVYAKAGNQLHVLYLELIFLFLYLIVTFGTKCIGIFQTKQSLKQFPLDAHIFLLSGTAASFILGMFFWEQVGGPNTFNFLVTIFVMGGLYAALASDYWMNQLPKHLRMLFIIAIVLLTIPRVLYATWFLSTSFSKVTFIGNKEIAALDYLREKTPSSAIFIASPGMGTELFSPYIPFMTRRTSFLSGIKTELAEHSIPYQSRYTLYNEIFTSSDSARVKQILHKNAISYVYMPALDTFPVATMSAWISVAFNNGSIKILKIH